jgi:hypothetical protein
VGRRGEVVIVLWKASRQAPFFSLLRLQGGRGGLLYLAILFCRLLSADLGILWARKSSGLYIDCEKVTVVQLVCDFFLDDPHNDHGIRTQLVVQRERSFAH